MQNIWTSRQNSPSRRSTSSHSKKNVHRYVLMRMHFLFLVRYMMNEWKCVTNDKHPVPYDNLKVTCMTSTLGMSRHHRHFPHLRKCHILSNVKVPFWCRSICKSLKRAWYPLIGSRISQSDVVQIVLHALFFAFLKKSLLGHLLGH